MKSSQHYSIGNTYGVRHDYVRMMLNERVRETRNICLWSVKEYGSI